MVDAPVFILYNIDKKGMHVNTLIFRRYKNKTGATTNATPAFLCHMNYI